MENIRQVAFEKAFIALYKQGKRSTVVSRSGTGTGCMYRGPGGTKCAIGHLIDDKFYYPDMEFCGVRAQYVAKALEESLGCELTDDIEFFSDMQRHLHDNLDDSEFCDQLLTAAHQFAISYNLTMPEILVAHSPS